MIRKKHALGLRPDGCAAAFSLATNTERVCAGIMLNQKAAQSAGKSASDRLMRDAKADRAGGMLSRGDRRTVMAMRPDLTATQLKLSSLNSGVR